MSSYNSNLQTNNTNLQSILDTINALPEAGTDLPELTNPANASEVFLGKEVINQDGNTVTGTFTIDNEVNTQEDLLAELQTALNGKIGGSGSGNIDTCIVTIEGVSHIPYISYTKLENGLITAKSMHINISDSVTILDCICNSCLCIIELNTQATVTTSQAELLSSYNDQFYSFKITADAGSTSVITFSGIGTGGGAID